MKTIFASLLIVCLCAAVVSALPTGNLPPGNQKNPPAGNTDNSDYGETGSSTNNNTGTTDPNPKISTAPEPATLFLIGFGLIALGFIVRRKKAIA